MNTCVLVMLLLLAALTGGEGSVLEAKLALNRVGILGP